MPKKQVPSLSANGWLTEISEKADALMAYYITSEHSQTYLYKGRITSLPHHIQKNGSEPTRLESTVENDLGDYFRRHFEDVEITVSAKPVSDKEPNNINLTIDCIVVEGGERYSLGREIKVEDDRIVNIFDKLKGG